MSKTIALVEDEPAIRENYQAALERHGYTVKTYVDYQTAASGFEKKLPDLAILDINLPDRPEGGFELCRQLRHASQRLPIMFLTALDSEFDAVSGLRLGADDYVTKDTSQAHFMARVSALIRRLIVSETPQQETEVLEEGPLRLDLERITVHWQSTPVDLTLTEFWMVRALVKHPGHVKSRDHLMEIANVVVDDSTITSHIKRIRKKFQQIDDNFDRIDTVYGAGYRWKS